MARSAAAPGTAQGGRWRLLAVRAGRWHSPAVRGGRGAGCLLRLFLLGRCLRGARGGAGWSGRGGGPCCAFGICGKKGKKAQPGSLPLQGKRCGRCSGSERTSPSCRGTLRPLCCVQSTQPEVGSNPSPGGIAVGSQQSQSPQHAHTPPSRVQAAGRGPGHPVCHRHRHGTEMGGELGLHGAGSEGRRAQAGRGPWGGKGATGHGEEGDAPQPWGGCPCSSKKGPWGHLEGTEVPWGPVLAQPRGARAPTSSWLPLPAAPAAGASTWPGGHRRGTSGTCKH